MKIPSSSGGRRYMHAPSDNLADPTACPSSATALCIHRPGPWRTNAVMPCYPERFQSLTSVCSYGQGVRGPDAAVQLARLCLSVLRCRKIRYASAAWMPYRCAWKGLFPPEQTFPT
jgi:hypothetical protein